MAEFHYQAMFEHSEDTTSYRKLTSDYVSTSEFEGREILKVDPAGLTLLAREALDDVTHLLRTDHPRRRATLVGPADSAPTALQQNAWHHTSRRHCHN